MSLLNKFFKKDNTGSSDERRTIIQQISSEWFMASSNDKQLKKTIVAGSDPVRYGTLYLAFGQIIKDKIEGSLAECGVYKGHLSKFIHTVIPDRKLYLFDTFEGFDDRDKDSPDDKRFRDTSEEGVREHIGDLNNVVIRKGFFPETAKGLEDERFAFVMLDFDKYEPTMAGLELFYSRINPGGFLLVHDYTNPESNWACSRAFDKFLSDKPEKPILLPDSWGTALIRKI